MRIAVLGSWRESDRKKGGLRHRTSFFEAATALGARIAEHGHSLLVGSDGSDTADYHAAVGAAGVAAKQHLKGPRIHILAPKNRPDTFPDLRQQYTGLFSEQFVPADDWAPAKVFQVREADAVLILAGSQASLQAGLTAAATGKRLVCLGSFGGAAKHLNDLFMSSRESWGRCLPDADELGVLQGSLARGVHRSRRVAAARGKQAPSPDHPWP